MSKSPFSNIFMGQKIALKMVLLIKLKFIITASKLWMTGPHEPEAGPEGGIKKNQQCFS